LGLYMCAQAVVLLCDLHDYGGMPRKQRQLRLSKDLIKRLNKIAEEDGKREKTTERYIDPTLYKVVSITAPISDAGKHFFAILVPVRNIYSLGPSSRWDDDENALTNGFLGYREHIRVPVKPDAVYLGQIVRIVIEPLPTADASSSPEKETVQDSQ
jgi:hypothetical protein